jgi:hypothetical protein
MSAYQRVMERLRRPIFPKEWAGGEESAERIAQLQRNARCARRAVGLMVLLTAFAAAGLGYPTILVENFPYHAPPLLLNLIYAVGIGSLISLLTFAGLGAAYRRKLRRQEEARRQMAGFETPPRQPDTISLRSMPEGGLGANNDGSA